MTENFEAFDPIETPEAEDASLAKRTAQLIEENKGAQEEITAYNAVADAEDGNPELEDLETEKTSELNTLTSQIDAWGQEIEVPGDDQVSANIV